MLLCVLPDIPYVSRFVKFNLIPVWTSNASGMYEININKFGEFKDFSCKKYVKVRLDTNVIKLDLCQQNETLIYCTKDLFCYFVIRNFMQVQFWNFPLQYIEQNNV